MVMKGETLSSKSLETCCGGKGLNQSISLARAGIKVCHAGMVGTDGQILLDTCKREGIDIKAIEVCNEKSGHAIIQVSPEGENCILLYGGANRKNSEAHILEALKDFEAGDILLLQNEINLVDVLIERASEKKMKIVLNPSPFEDSLLNCRLEEVGIFLINETEGMQMSGETSPEQILKCLHQRYPKSEIVLTLGEKGVIGCYGEELIHVPAFHVNAVDTTAAGDTFTGYYLAGILQGRGYEESLKRANAASALAVMKKGAADSIPKVWEVESFLQSR